ncbi:MAG: fluoride efflux transporter CrcB [Lachnospiraceae bacterium]|nr:fluoride efflux transporter CrcB [Lachnospiraceae bacterium]
MSAYLCVGLGGALGAMLRYALSTVTVKSDFPLMTFLTNLIGAVLIGLIVGLVSGSKLRSDQLILFLKTGFCGGFTTFSTFSLETMTLLERGCYITGGCYAVCSLVCCIAGVWIGKCLAGLAVGA